MYRIAESTIPTHAEVFHQMAKNKNTEREYALREKAAKDLVKITNHCLRKIASAAEKGDYWMYYEYSPSILDRLLFWQTPVWNEMTRELLGEKLRGMNFHCMKNVGSSFHISWKE